MVGAKEGVGVDQPGESTADERPDPVNPKVGEVSAGDGGAEGAGRVHGPAGKGAGGEDVSADDEADGDGGDGAEGALLGVRCRRVDRVHEREGDDDLHHHAGASAHSGPQSMRRRVLQSTLIKSTVN